MKLLLGSHYIVEECKSNHRKVDMKTGVLCAKNILPIAVLSTIMKNPAIIVLLHEETEDKVADGLTYGLAKTD